MLTDNEILDLELQYKNDSTVLSLIKYIKTCDETISQLRNEIVSLEECDEYV